MPAERVLRPVRTRAFAIALSAAITGAALLGWFLLPAHIRAQFTAFQLVTLLIILGFMVAAMLLLGFSAVRVDDRGLAIRNGPFTRRVRWGEIGSIRFRHGDPWAYVILTGDTDDPKRIAMLGIQATDRQRAIDAVAWLRERATQA